VEYKIRSWVFFVLQVAQIKKAKDFFGDELHTRASTGKPRKPLSPPGLVYRHKKGTWEGQEKKKTKEGEKVARQGWSIATRRGREKEKKRKKPRKAKRWLQRRQDCVCPQPRISFFGSRVFGFGSGPSCLKYRILFTTRVSLRGSNVRRKFRKRTTLRSESSTLKGLLYAGWRSRCEAFVTRKVCTIAGAKCEQESCHLTSDNQILFTSWISSGDSKLGLYCVAWLT
jgi:hypothetical protein